MKTACYSILLLSILLITSESYSRDEFPMLEGPYLGQQGPGLVPERFAPGIIQTHEWEGGATITPDGKYLFFNRVVAPGIGDEWPDVDTYWVDAQIIEALRPKL
ncbi:MAG: hypothetical protein HKN85_12660 [Gammaproteobacteria bacterium]|nr:hypothetical protein [Gammaproteobacteria bacterium]